MKDTEENIQFFKDQVLDHGASIGDIKLINMALNYGADINSAVQGLRLAIVHGHFDAVKTIIKKGYDLQNNDEFDPTYYAASAGQLEILEYFVEEHKLTIHENALRIAALEGHLETIKYLVRNGADIKDEGSTALLFAADHNYPDVVEYLAIKGADVEIRNNEPLRLSCARGHLETTKRLIENGADINIGFIEASAFGKVKIMEYLVKNGADIHIKNDLPLRTASEGNHTEALKYLTSLILKEKNK